MKTISKFLLAILAFGVTSISTIQAQEADEQPYFILSYNHLNLEDEDLDKKRWIEMEKEYRTKVLNNNEYINNFFTFTHSITDDNSEVIHGMIIRGWDNIKKMQDANDELVQKAWPDVEERQAFFKEMNSFYTTEHSDEIYYALPYHTKVENFEGEDLVIHFQNHEVKAAIGPATGNEEFTDMQNWYMNDIVAKNEHVLGYFPYTHAWGSNGTDFLELWIYESLAGMYKARKRTSEIFKSLENDENRKAMEAIEKKYFTHHHTDQVYGRVSELAKRTINQELSK